jgi:hypothetical protein
MQWEKNVCGHAFILRYNAYTVVVLLNIKKLHKRPPIGFLTNYQTKSQHIQQIKVLKYSWLFIPPFEQMGT